MTIRDLMKNRVMILDGAMGTMLGKYEADLLPFPEQLNLTDAALVADIHRRYADAGADIITTFTLKANCYQAKIYGVDLETLIMSACQNARIGAPEAYIAQSIGPLRQGKACDAKAWEAQYSAFVEVIGYGLKAGIDAVLLESFDDIDEARMAILAARSLTDLPVLVSFAMLEQEESAVEAIFEKIALVIETLDVDAIGLNCGLSPEPMVDHFMKLKARVMKPIFVQPNAGRYKMSGNKRLYLENVELFKSAMARCVSEGAALVGGCCGTTPQYIQGISRLKKTYCRSIKKSVSITQRSNKNDFEPIRGALIAASFDASGSSVLKHMMINRKTETILEEAKRIGQNGFDRMVLHGYEAIDGVFLQDIVLKLTQETGIDLVLSAADIAILEAMLMVYPERAIITGPWHLVEKRCEAYRLSKRYGAEVMLDLEVLPGPSSYEQRALQVLDALVNEAQITGLDRKSLILKIDAEKALRDGATYGEILSLIRTLKNTSQIKSYINMEGLSHTAHGSDALAMTFGVLAMAQGVNYLAVNADQLIYAHLLKGLKELHGVSA